MRKRPWMSTPYFLSLLLLFVLYGPGIATGQDVIDRERIQEKFVNEEVDRRGQEAGLTDGEEDLSQDLDIDYGGFFRYSYYDFDDGEDQHILRIADLRLWTNVVYRDAHQVYARVMGDIQSYNKGTNYYYQEQIDDNYPRLDVGYYRTDLTRALGIEELGTLRIKAGRDYFSLGSGMVLDRRGEGGHLEYKLGGFSLTGFVMRSIKSEDSTDRTHPDFGHDKRLFSGLEISHEFTRELNLFGYTLHERFKNRKEFAFTTQKFGNDSTYFGGGAKGSIGPNFTYAAEYAIERGFRYSDGWRERSDVKASAYNLEAEYTFRSVPMRPQFSFQYLFGSGDRDAGNTLDTIGGNAGGTDYDAFTGYGNINTGLAFFMKQSNIKITRLGTVICPLEKTEGCDNLEVGANFLHYRKDESSGGISDRFTVPGTGYLGREVDFTVTWRPFSDVSVIAQYGVFKPNREAFVDDAYRYYFSVGTVIFF